MPRHKAVIAHNHSETGHARGHPAARHDPKVLNRIGAFSWFALLTVIFGGYFLLRYLTDNGLSDFEERFFRAGHAHGGVLVLASLLYGWYLGRTAFSDRQRIAAYVLYAVGAIAQSGGFFLHMAVGEPGQGSIGTTVTATGAGIIAIAVLLLLIGLLTGPEAEPRERRDLT